MCAGLALLPLASQSKHKTNPRHSQAPQPQLELAVGLTPWPLLRRVSALYLLTSPETQMGPQNTLPQARAQKADKAS